jgi:hypothetical protein
MARQKFSHFGHLYSIEYIGPWHTSSRLHQYLDHSLQCLDHSLIKKGLNRDIYATVPRTLRPAERFLSRFQRATKDKKVELLGERQQSTTYIRASYRYPASTPVRLSAQSITPGGMLWRHQWHHG